MTQNSWLFMEANKRSPVVYMSIDPNRGGCFYRLLNGKTFDLNHRDCQLVGHPRWAHLP